jgi:dTDP-4-dehydrorhamnose 3,5-epimerase
MIEVHSLAIPEVKLITPRRFGDKRGFFQQTYHKNIYKEFGIDADFVQDNWSRSVKGVLRGLHYQLKNPQAKLVSVITGKVYDVAVDIRKGSPTFGQWVGAELSDENGCQLFVPRGFAHGFVVLSETVDFFYKCDNFYTPGDEYGVLWSDQDINIQWPGTGEKPTVSEKDETVLPLKSVSSEDLPVY